MWGEVWPIGEPDLLMQVETLLDQLEHSGELARLNETARVRARARLEAPPPVPGIVPALAPRTWLYDPAIVVQDDLVASDGAVIGAAGTRIEPLALRPLTRELLFIDGRRGRGGGVGAGPRRRRRRSCCWPAGRWI